MKRKQFWSFLLACALMVGSIISAGAANIPDDYTVILRVSGRVDQSIAAKSIVNLDEWFYLDKDDTVKFTCTYTPKSASIDFGIVDSSGVFHYLNCTSGSINKSIKVNQTGEYTLAIRNNENYAVTVTGTVRY